MSESNFLPKFVVDILDVSVVLTICGVENRVFSEIMCKLSAIAEEQESPTAPEQRHNGGDSPSELKIKVDELERYLQICRLGLIHAGRVHPTPNQKEFRASFEIISGLIHTTLFMLFEVNGISQAAFDSTRSPFTCKQPGKDQGKVYEHEMDSNNRARA